MWTSRRTLESALCVLALSFVIVSLRSYAAPTNTEIPFGAHGDSMGQSAGAPVELSPTAFIVAAEGADGEPGTADDVVLLVRHLNTTPQIRELPTPYLAARARLARLSASRSLAIGAGPDGEWLSSDDVVYLLSQVGSEDPVTAITVGGLNESGGCAPQTLAADRAVVATAGPDNVVNTADDEIVLLTRLGDENGVTHLPAPYLRDGGVTRPEILTPHAILVASTGADGEAETADDLTYVFTELAGANERDDLATPYLFDRAAPGRAVRASGTSAVVASVGEDGKRATADDLVYLLDDLGSSNRVTAVPVGPILSFGAGRPMPLTADRTVIASPGPDEEEETADDELVVIVETPTGIEVDHVRVGGLSYDAVSRPRRLSSASCAVATGGANAKIGTQDDEVVVLTSAGGMNAVARVPVPGLQLWASTAVVPLSKTSFAVSNGGPDGQFGTSDDTVSFVTDIDTGFTLTAVPIGGPFDGSAPFCQTLQLLGSQRAVLVIPGPDARVGKGGDDRLLVFEDIPEGFGFQVRKMVARFKQGRSERPARVTATYELMLQERERFAAGPLTFSMGDAAQTIPGEAFEQNAKGVFRYRDKKGLNGFLRKVQWNPRTGSLTVKGKGTGTGLETTDPAECSITLAGPDWSCGETIQGTAKKTGFKYKAPK